MFLIKASIRLWPMKNLGIDSKLLDDPRGTFQHPPSNKPIKILVRVYCVAVSRLIVRHIFSCPTSFTPYVQLFEICCLV